MNANSIQWDHQIFESTFWIAKAFFLSCVGLALAFLAIVKLTVWGRQIWKLTGPYFNPKRNLRPILYVLGTIFFTLFGVRMNVLLSFWGNSFFTSLQNLDAKIFWIMMGVFAILASIHVLRAMLDYFLRQAFQIDWRIWLTEDLLNRWFQQQAYHRSQFLKNPPDNPDQRIQQDVTSFVGNLINLASGLLDSVVSLVEFTVILWSLSGVLNLFGLEIPRAMVFLVYIYVLITTVVAVKVGRPLIQLNFLNEKLAANFRYSLVRLREYSESIAFYRGEGVEQKILLKHFGKLISNVWSIVYRSIKLTSVNLSVSQAAVVFPYIVQAPRFFSKLITLGEVSQTAQSFSQVQTALSFLRNSYDDFANIRAELTRLVEFVESMSDTKNLPKPNTTVSSRGLQIQDLTVSTPNNQVIVKSLNLDLPLGATLLIRGPSGAGKTTLLRAMSGLWPYATGDILIPEPRHPLFLPQRAYLPQGNLRQALFYPGNPQDSESLIQSTLEKCQLAHLAGHLDEDAHWAKILSFGEQQRLSIARALLNPSNCLFLDEATSAMDEGLEFAMYKLLRQELPTTTMVSIGHRSSLIQFHDYELKLTGHGDWQLTRLS